MKTDDFINALSEDAPVSASLSRAFALATILGGAVSAGLFLAAIRPRPDIGAAAETVRFLFKFVVTISLAISAGGLVLRLVRPGVRPGLWGLALAVAPALLIAAVVLELMVMPSSSWGTRWIGVNARYCLSLIPLLALGPLACLLYALRLGAPEHPGRAGAVAGLLASGIAATFYASHCVDDSPLFVATWYPLATAIVTAAGYFAGRRLLRW
ncbi:NrsF family protein [Labrys neptuniae]